MSSKHKVSPLKHKFLPSRQEVTPSKHKVSPSNTFETCSRAFEASCIFIQVAKSFAFKRIRNVLESLRGIMHLHSGCHQSKKYRPPNIKFRPQNKKFRSRCIKVLLRNIRFRPQTYSKHARETSRRSDFAF